MLILNKQNFNIFSMSGDIAVGKFLVGHSVHIICKRTSECMYESCERRYIQGAAGKLQIILKMKITNCI